MRYRRAVRATIKILKGFTKLYIYMGFRKMYISNWKGFTKLYIGELKKQGQKYYQFLEGLRQRRAASAQGTLGPTWKWRDGYGAPQNLFNQKIFQKDFLLLRAWDGAPPIYGVV